MRHLLIVMQEEDDIITGQCNLFFLLNFLSRSQIQGFGFYSNPAVVQVTYGIEYITRVI